MTEVVMSKWYHLKALWKKASWWQKGLIVITIYPVWPTIAFLGYKFAPPEVLQSAAESGEAVTTLMGTSFQLASYHFVQLFLL